MKVKVWMVLGCFLLSGLLSSEVNADSGFDTVIDSRILEQGDNRIHGFAYFDGYLWASTRTSPCRILKINPETLDYESIILDAGLNKGEDLIAADGYIWVILRAAIVKVNPETLEWEIAITFQQGELWQGGSLEYAFGYLWAGGGGGRIARINPGDLSYQIYDYSAATGNFQFHALTSGGGYIWGSSPIYRGSWLWGFEWVADTIVRINPDDPTDYASVSISAPMSDDIAYVDGHLYTGSEESPSYIYKISDDLTYSKARGGDTICYGVFAWDDTIWGAYVGSPGRIVRFDLNLNVEAAYQLPSGFNNANEIAFDPSGNLYYVTCWESPAKIVKLERREIQYFISKPPDGDRGGVIIPIELFPEGEEALIPIYVPPVIDGSNEVREDNGWKTIREIKKSKISFEWEKLIAGFAPEWDPEAIYESAGAGFLLAAEFLEALHNAISVSACKITIQKDPGGNLRAVIQVGDPDSRTFIRMHAGKTWMPFAESFWLIQAVLSEQIAETFRLEPDKFPRVRYTMTLNIDPSHKDDLYIGYLSLAEAGKIVMTPKVYPKDKLRILRVHQIVIPYKIETVIELAGDGFVSLMEGAVDPGFIEMLSPLVSESAIVVQGRSPIELRVYDSQARVTGLVNGEIKEEIPKSIYDNEHRIVMILSPADVYRYEAAGTDQGEYELDVSFVEGGESTTFTAAHIPASASSVHQYAIDWAALSRGEEGVTVQIDADGDGTFEQAIIADSEFTQDEYLHVTGVTPDGRHLTTWAGLKRTALFQNYPNPFNPDTWIPYVLAADQTQVEIKIYAATGRLVRTLNLGDKPAGVYFSKEKAAHWDGRNQVGEEVSNGVYFYIMQAGDFTATRKMSALQ